MQEGKREKLTHTHSEREREREREYKFECYKNIYKLRRDSQYMR